MINKLCRECSSSVEAKLSRKVYCSKTCRDKANARRRYIAANRENKRLQAEWLALPHHPARQEYLAALFARVQRGDFSPVERTALTCPTFFQGKSEQKAGAQDSEGDQPRIANIAVAFNAFCRNQHGVASYEAFKAGYTRHRSGHNDDVSQASCLIEKNSGEGRPDEDHLEVALEKSEHTTARPAWLNWDD